MNDMKYEEIEDPGFRLDDVTKSNLRLVNERRLDKDYDFVLVVVGDVGDGKSSLANLACGYVGKLTGVPFTAQNVFFNRADYQKRKKTLPLKSSMNFDEGGQTFFSRTAMSKDQRKLIQEFAQIRQQKHFITICTPSILLLEKWFRTGVESRVDCIWRVVRRGKFFSYASKTGSLQRININRRENNIYYPSADFLGYWKAIPKKSGFWKQYTKKKMGFLRGKDEKEESDDEEMDESELMELMKKSMNVSEASKYLGLAKKSIYTMKSQGTLPNEAYFKVGGRLRIRTDWLKSYLKENINQL